MHHKTGRTTWWTYETGIKVFPSSNMQESTRVQMTYISLSDNACEGLCGRPQRCYNIMQQEFLPVCVYWIIIPALARLSHKFSVVFKACSTVPRWPSKQFQDIWNIGFKSYVCLLWHMIAVTIKYSKTLLLLLLSRFGHRGLHRGVSVDHTCSGAS